MRCLSLFTGCGGDVLTTHHLLGWEIYGYVEWDDYAQRVVAQRILDGVLPTAPIFGDVETFASAGYASSYQGMVDVVTAGFPCQPWAAGGKLRGSNDPRNMWGATVRVLSAVRPPHVFLENTPRLASRVRGNAPYLRRIITDLSSLGYVGRWGVLSAATLGFPHRRDRLWIIAHSGEDGRSRLLRRNIRRINAPLEIAWRTDQSANALASVCRTLREFEERVGEPAIFGSNDGDPNRVDRLGATGSAWVPIVAATVWQSFS